MNTVAGMRELTFEEHKKLGLGVTRDSSLLGQHTSLLSTFQSLPGLTVRGTPSNFSVKSQRCPKGLSVYLDGHPEPSLGLVDSKSLAVMEMYKSGAIFPPDVPGGKGCVIVLWSKAALNK